LFLIPGIPDHGFRHSVGEKRFSWPDTFPGPSREEAFINSIFIICYGKSPVKINTKAVVEKINSLHPSLVLIGGDLIYRNEENFLIHNFRREKGISR